MNFFKNFSVFADYFIPRLCLCCDNKLESNQKIICPDCLAKIQLISPDRLKSEFEQKFLAAKKIDNLFSLFLFEPDGNIQTLLHELKYNNKFLVGKYLGELIAESLSNKIDVDEIDLVIPMPLHKLKKAERGYNQAYYIAKGLARKLKIKLDSGNLKRKKYTQSQTKLNLLERRENMRDAFKVRNEKLLEGKNILLVDDVITTGASVSEAANVLKENGANKVYACSAAFTENS